MCLRIIRLLGYGPQPQPRGSSSRGTAAPLGHSLQHEREHEHEKEHEKEHELDCRLVPAESGTGLTRAEC